ncbi:hypothetical protein CDD82_1346 [Ophiocordyceps australis]|uniref:Amino acid permease/ SLC12A domain-containing protein n=1 Tax=Ophiocordyceps australis TaxID=1399860 RepID=A0A2C5ZU65_9HYPO|nr:hypothetical protein CDD82_1346 [Ophiocordyceps australis]
MAPAAAADAKRHGKLGLVSGVFIPVCLNIISIIMFLRFGLIIGQVGFFGILGLLITAYLIDLLTVLSLSAISSNGEVRGGGAYYLISRSLGPEFGGSIGLVFFLSQSLNTALNIVGLIDCIRLNIGDAFPKGYWIGYSLQTAALLLCFGLSLLGPATFSKASNALLAILTLAVVSIPLSAIFRKPFEDAATGIEYTGIRWTTLTDNLVPRPSNPNYHGVATFRDLFGILFPATAGIFSGASMSGDLRNPSKAIPKGTLWAMVATFIVYLAIILSMASTTTHESFLANTNVLSLTNIYSPIILAGECAVTFFSALTGIIASAKLLQALARDNLIPGLSFFSKGTKRANIPIPAICLTYTMVQVALLADLNYIATLISMGCQMTFFVMNLACFLLKIGSAPNFRPSFKFFTWQTALLGSLASAAAMFFIDDTYASIAICALVFIFMLIHYLGPPKSWGDVSQNLIYHQVRKYLLRLKPEHIKFWRPHIILFINDPRRQTRLIQFCNALKKGSLYILGHVIVTDDFDSAVEEARFQRHAWSDYISDYSKIKAFLQLTISPSITWGIRNMILSAGLGGMRPNIAVLGFYNMHHLRQSNPHVPRSCSPVPSSFSAPDALSSDSKDKASSKQIRRDISAILLSQALPTDEIRTEEMMGPTDYTTILEDLALRHRFNVALAYGFDSLDAPARGENDSARFIDLWPIQMSANVAAEGNNVSTKNFDTYTLILQLGHILQSAQTWRKLYSLRVMVFVEYESELEAEIARVHALLEKLRIDAQVLALSLSSGTLKTYELIINGNTQDNAVVATVNEALKGENWWEELQSFRGKNDVASSMMDTATLAQIFDRKSSLNRRHSMTTLAEANKKSEMSFLSRAAANMRLRSRHLRGSVRGASSSNVNLAADLDSSDYDESEDDLDGPWSRGGTRYDKDNGKRPLLAGRRYHTTQPSVPGEGRNNMEGRLLNPQSFGEYGSMSSGQAQSIKRDLPASERIPQAPKSGCASPSQSVESPATFSQSWRRDGGKTLANYSHHSSAAPFSSRPVPETMVTRDAEGAVLGFAPQDEDSLPPSRRRSGGLEEEVPKTVRFQHGTTAASSPAGQSRRRSLSQHGSPSSTSLCIPQLADSHKAQSDGDRGSEYSTQSVGLSFNDLPSRAQHLILNELMRQHSEKTAVAMTTLPVPFEGTGKDETASIRYLSDVETLCNGLVPMLLVLSNSITVTVNL